MPAAGSQGSHRKTFAVKHQDGEPLTRTDLQYDLLYYLFTDNRAVFTDPHPTISGEPAGSKVTFRNLYVNALVHSPRCSKVSRDKLLDTPQFADEFAKISLLSNVGRINTTMAFFPEMRTALRTYHPVPSLQKTDGNLQDAPRIKNILKSCLLSSEVQNTPATPAEVLSRSRGGIVPPTSIVNLIFVFASHSTMLAQSHFPPQSAFELLDFFSPINVSSESRARAFLWLCFHYYEAPSVNPFGDDHSRHHLGSIPALESLSAEEALLENLDTPEEKAWGEKMTGQRRLFMEMKDKEQSTGDTSIGSQELEASTSAPKQRASRKGQGKGKGSNKRAVQRHPLVAGALDFKVSRQSSLSLADEHSFQSLTPDHSVVEEALAGPSRGSRRKGTHLRDLSLSPDPHHRLPPQEPPYPSPPMLSSEHTHRRESYTYPRQPSSISTEPYPPRRPGGDLSSTVSSDGQPIRHRRGNKHISPLAGPALTPLHQLEPYSKESPPRELPPLAMPSSPPMYIDTDPGAISHRHPTSVLSFTAPSMTFPPVPPPTRTMLEQAWHVVMTTDPLEDSEDEPDENTRLDLLLRLKIINRLRGKEPTPEPTPEPQPAVRVPEPVRHQRHTQRSRATRRA